VHYVYGIWDGAPVANNVLLTQSISSATYGTAKVRTITANAPDWSNARGWKIALPAGERVTGELPFEKNGRFYFLSSNPTIINTTLPNGDNWLYELVMTTGGSPSIPIFDLNLDRIFSSADLASGCTASGVITCIPIAKSLGAGVSSQPTYVEGVGFNTTLYTNHPDTVTSTGTVGAPPDPGVSSGHFDVDNYYPTSNSSSLTTTVKTNTNQTKTNICTTEANLLTELDAVSPTFCTSGNGFSSGYTYMTAYVSTGSDKSCKNSSKTKKRFSITCNTVTTTTSTVNSQYYSGPFSKQKQNQIHVHEYDDIYNVTGVNMLNASVTELNLANAITSTSTAFKVLVLNQYLNPAAKLSVGGTTYVNIKDYPVSTKRLIDAADATTVLSSLTNYTRASVSTLIFNLPLDAFKSKDWWGDGASVRAGLLPTNYSCVAYLKDDGTGAMFDSIGTTGAGSSGTGKGLNGPNGERFDGALTIQLIKDTTPASALELNFSNTGTVKNGDGTTGSGTMSVSDRARYGWRVKQSEFTNYVLAEYTTYWHHPNNKCYGQSGWIAAAPEDTISDATAKTPATGSADPKDGIFSGGASVVSVVTGTVGNIKTTVTKYSDNLTYTKVEVTNGDGSTTVTQTFRDNTTAVTTLSTAGIGNSSIISSPEEDTSTGATGRQTWWEILQ
jgi:hypothetical protein